MRRVSHRALVCALLCLLLGGAPALAAGTHKRHAQRTTAVESATATVAAQSGSSAKATTQDGLKVLNDCQNHGQLTRGYPVAWLRKAKSMMSSDTAEYSNCSSVIQSAILHSVKGDSGGSSSSGTTTIVIIVVVVLVILAALLGVLALRRRRRGGPTSAA